MMSSVFASGNRSATSRPEMISFGTPKPTWKSRSRVIVSRCSSSVAMWR